MPHGNPFAVAEQMRAGADVHAKQRALIEAASGEDTPEAAALRACYDSLSAFVRAGWSIMEPGVPLVWNWHLDYICAHLEAVTAGHVRRLIINVPPGHMKSLITSVFWPAWMWLKKPELRVLCASYALSLAIRDASKTKDLVTSDWYQNAFRPPWKIRHDSKAKQDYQNTVRGMRKSVSVGAGTTGFRGTGVIIDDPLSIMDGYSEAKRSEARTWLFEAAQNRLADPRVGWIVMIMQRVHHEDPTGAALEKVVDKWEHLCLMSEFEPERAFRTILADIPGFEQYGTDPRKEAGELLFKEFFTKEVIEGQKESLQALAFAGQHQQRPTPAQGNIFKGEMFCKILSIERGEPRLGMWPPEKIFGDLKILEAYMSWDTAMKDKTANDYTAGCLTMLANDGYVYLLPLVFNRMEVPDVEKAVVLQWVKWKAMLGAALKGCRIEEGAGTALIQYIRRLMLARRDQQKVPVPGWTQAEWDSIRAAPPIVVYPFITRQNKIEKAYEVLPYVAAQNVRLLDSPLSQAWLGNLLGFPLSGRDDPVDATVNGIGPFAGVVKGLSVMPQHLMEAVVDREEDFDPSHYAEDAAPELASELAEELAPALAAPRSPFDDVMED